MEDQTNFLLDWTYFCHGKSMEELTESLLITTMELEATKFKAQEELKTKDDQIFQLKHLLHTAINEKHEAQNRYQILLQTTVRPPHSAVTSGEDDHITNGGFCSSDCEESIVSSPVSENVELGFPVKSLPEKGKFLEAVMKAGPLLQNILLAGPLPHWRNPPPPLDTCQIPPPPVVVTTPLPVNRLVGEFNKKRGFPEGSDSSIDTRCQRINMNGL